MMEVNSASKPTDRLSKIKFSINLKNSADLASKLTSHRNRQAILQFSAIRVITHTRAWLKLKSWN